MKKTIIAMFALSGGILSFSACQKDIFDIENGEASNFTVTRTVTVSEDPWTASTRTAFIDGEGIKVTGEESMAMFYYAGEDRAKVSNLTKTTATPNEKGKYVFTHSSQNGTTYNYWYVLPDNARVTTNSTDDAHQFWLHPTQFPAEDSFDSNMDALVGKAQYGHKVSRTSTDDNPYKKASAVEFRRLFSHLELKLSDGASVLGDEKIHAVTFALGTTPTTSAALTGIVWPVHSDVYSDIPNTMETPGNAVTAHYPEGLAKNADGTYHIWYVVNPMEIAAGTEVTVTVTADTKTITRTATFPEAVGIKKGKINHLGFNISGSGYTKEPSAYYDLTSSSLSSEWKKGSTVEVKTDGEGYTNSLYLDAPKTTSTLTYTVPSGKTVKGIKLYTHPQNPNANTGLTITCGTKACGTYNLNYAADAEPATSGGFRHFYDGMSTNTEYAWPESISTFKFSASSSHNNSIRLVDAVVLFEADSSVAGE